MEERVYMNKECGNILTLQEMLDEASELYDLDDPTNLFAYGEYYERIS